MKTKQKALKGFCGGKKWKKKKWLMIFNKLLTPYTAALRPIKKKKRKKIAVVD